MNRFIIIALILSSSMSILAHGNPLEHYPEWSVSVEEGDDEAAKKYFLEPGDGRPTIAVTANAAERMQNGTLNPADVYRGLDEGAKASAEIERHSQQSAGFAASSGGGGQGSSGYTRLGPGTPAPRNTAPVFSANTNGASVASAPAPTTPAVTKGGFNTSGASGAVAGNPDNVAVKAPPKPPVDNLEIDYEDSMPNPGAGCTYYVVPLNVTKLKITAVGGGGGGSRSTPRCAYHMLSGGGGAAVTAYVKVKPMQKIKYCVGRGGKAATGTGYSKGVCGDVKGKAGTTSSFGSYVVARGGEGGNTWHYKGKDGRGRPPSAGGTFTIGTGATKIKAANGETVSTRDSCGGDAGLGLGKGACSSSDGPGKKYGGGGYGGGRNYSLGPEATAGGPGLVKIEIVK